jgi:dihydroneopterin aldolase
VFLRDLVLQAHIGVYAQEQGGTQRIRVNVDLGVDDPGAADPTLQEGPDRLSRVVDYGKVGATVRSIVEAGHILLVETLAERIAAACLSDPRVRLARIRVEKLDIFPDAVAVGVEVERRRG